LKRNCASTRKKKSSLKEGVVSLSRSHNVAATRRAGAICFAVAFGAFWLGLGSQVKADTTIADTPPASSSQPADQWETNITPYIWAPTIHGELNFTVPTGPQGTGPAAGFTVTPSKYVPHLGSAFMFTAETHNRTWGVATDLIYLNLGVSTAGVTTISGPGGRVMIPINPNADVRFASTVWTLAGTYNLGRCAHGNVDALLGGRYIYAPVRVDWNFSGPLGILGQSGSHYESASIWDAIIGVKGKYQLGSDGHWFIPYYADVGTGDAPLTWQGIGGIGYATKHTAITLVYRNLFYDQGSTHLIHNLNLGGPALGYTFKL
jgi:hypothetical protein